MYIIYFYLHYDISFSAYDPADYEHLPVGQDIKELFQYITRYRNFEPSTSFMLKSGNVHTCGIPAFAVMFFWLCKFCFIFFVLHQTYLNQIFTYSVPFRTLSNVLFRWSIYIVFRTPKNAPWTTVLQVSIW